jgi:hypothetical protein
MFSTGLIHSAFITAAFLLRVSSGASGPLLPSDVQTFVSVGVQI